MLWISVSSHDAAHKKAQLWYDGSVESNKDQPAYISFLTYHEYMQWASGFSLEATGICHIQCILLTKPE